MTAPLPPAATPGEPSDNSEGRNYGLRKLAAGPSEGLSASEKAPDGGAGDGFRNPETGRCAGSGGDAVELSGVAPPVAGDYVWTGRCRVCGVRLELVRAPAFRLAIPEHISPTGVRS